MAWRHERGALLNRHLEPAWEGLAEQIQVADLLNLDVTGFGRKDRDWVRRAHSARTKRFHLSESRVATTRKAILPEECRGVIGTDR